MNQRVAPRKALQTRVIFADELSEPFLYFISKNISTSGIFIQTQLPLRAQTKVFLKFCLYLEDTPIHVAAEVMRVMHKKRGPGRRKPVIPGIGLKFLSLSHADFKKIAAFIRGE